MQKYEQWHWLCIIVGIDINLSASLQCALHDVAVSPLRVAVEYDKVDAVKWLCYQGANVNYREAVWNTKADDITSGMFVFGLYQREICVSKSARLILGGNYASQSPLG